MVASQQGRAMTAKFSDLLTEYLGLREIGSPEFGDYSGSATARTAQRIRLERMSALLAQMDDMMGERK